MRRGTLAAAVALAACAGDTIFIVDGGPPVDAPAACSSDAACDDGLFCNGVERCLPGAAGADAAGCVPGASPCLGGERCDEGGDACLESCAITPDADGDGVVALACGGLDCDDTRPDVFPGNVEVCDDASLDEDCDPSTVGTEDRDGDGVRVGPLLQPRPGRRARLRRGLQRRAAGTCGQASSRSATRSTTIATAGSTRA